MNKRSKSELNLKLLQQNTDLKDKIERSRPILTTIYEKVKKKQKILYDKINRDKRSIEDFKNIAKDYKKVYEQSLQMLQKNRSIQNFDKEIGNFMRNKNKDLPKQTQKSKSVYQQYRQKIQKSTANFLQQKNPQLEALQKKNQQLKQQIIKEIHHIRFIRQKSRQNLPKTKSNTYFKPIKNFNFQADQTTYKYRLAQRQKQKLQQIKQ